MRLPTPTIVIDAAVLISAAVGRGSGAIMAAQRAAVLITTDRVVHEAQRRVELGLKRSELIEVLDDLVSGIVVVPLVSLQPWQAASETALRDAVASRNGSARDAHVLALAWSIDADIWTADRDLAGTGVPTWSTPNLMRALAEMRRPA